MQIVVVTLNFHNFSSRTKRNEELAENTYAKNIREGNNLYVWPIIGS